MQSQRFAVIDVGSNTTKVHIAERAGNGYTQLLFKSYDVPLAPSDKEKKIMPASVEECLRVLQEIQQLMKTYAVTIYKAIGTEALRVAPNAAAVVNAIEEQTGIRIAVISREQEARLTLAAVQIDQQADNLACINGGGGSTEICWHLPTGDDYAILHFGAKNLTDNYLHAARGYTDIWDIIRRTTEATLYGMNRSELPQVGCVICIGGSIWAAAMLLLKIVPQHFAMLNTRVLQVHTLEALARQIITDPNSLQHNQYAPSGNRLRILPAGILVHTQLARLMGHEEITISTRSISDAVLRTFA